MISKRLKLAYEYIHSLEIEDITKANQYKDEECTQPEREINVLFPLAFILEALSISGLKPDLSWRKKITTFLKGQSQGKYSFNYWVRDSDLNEQFPLPDDIDDTAVVLASLSGYEDSIPAEFFLKFIAAEDKPGGPYRTWLINKDHQQYKKWSDIDPAVNANVLFFFAKQDIALSETREYLMKCLKADSIESPYYPYKLTTLFYASRYIKVAGDKEMFKLVSSLIKEYDFNKISNMEKILLLLSKSYLNEKLEKEKLAEVLALQDTDGSMPALPMCLDFKSGNKATYTGNKANTTALLIMLLGLQQQKSMPETGKVFIEKGLKNRIKKELDKREILLENKKLLPNIKEYKSISFPKIIALSFKTKLTKADQTEINNLSIGLYFSWLSYTMLDELIDTEKVCTGEYLVITTLNRLSVNMLDRLIQLTKKQKSTILQALDEVDYNYSWELENAKFRNNRDLPRLLKRNWDYNYIETRMSAYTYALSVIPSLIKVAEYDQQKLKRFFEIVMLIDQINDDAHDWEEDLKERTLTFVLVRLLRKEIKNKKRQRIIFWRELMPEIIADCEKLYKEGIVILKEFPNPTSLRKILEASFEPIKISKKEIKNTLKLIRKFNPKDQH